MDLDLEFIDTSAETIYNDIMDDVQNEIGEDLYPGDERAIFTNAMAYVIVAAFNSVNDACRQKMLRYAEDDVLDAIGEGRGVTRKQSEQAKVMLQFSMDIPATSNIVIPEGIRATGDYEHYFITDEAAVIEAGQTSVQVYATAEIGGSDYNGIDQGAINTIVDISQIPMISAVVNTTVSAGGADQEDDDLYRERIREAENSYSTAGTAKAYKYWALTADSTVIDAIVSREDKSVTKSVQVYDGHLFIGGDVIHEETLKIYKADGTEAVKDTDYTYAYEESLLDIKLINGMESLSNVQVEYTYTIPGHINIIPLVEGGGVPSDEVIQKVYDVCAGDDVKPLTDVVHVIKPQEVEYTIDIVYYTTTADASKVIENIEGAGGAIDQYKEWQCSGIGYDINPDELRKRVLMAGANRVTVNAPDYIELGDTQVAKCTGVRVSHITKEKY